MNPTLYGIPNCDTVKKARAWLTEHGIEYTFHDFKKQGLPADHLDLWINAVGWEKLVNRKGTMWRRLEPSAQERVKNVVTAKELMLATPSVIKRPVVEWDKKHTTVGFDTAVWQTLLAGR